MAEAHQQAAQGVQVRVTRHVLHTEGRGRADISTPSLALHSILIDCMTQRKALVLVLEDALYR